MNEEENKSTHTLEEKKVCVKYPQLTSSDEEIIVVAKIFAEFSGSYFDDIDAANFIKYVKRRVVG